MTTPLLEQEVLLKDGRILLCDYAPVFHNNVHTGHLLLYRDVTRERRIDAAKSEFMSLASHQLRTPLTTIRWSMGRLSKRLATKIDADDSKLIDEGKKAAIRMSDTIDAMLQIARIESNETHITVSRIALRPFIRKLIAEREIKAKMQKVSLSCPPRCSVKTDARLLQEILNNLLSNAFKYTPEHGKIAIRVRREKEEIIIDVRDSGYGIPLHDRKKIFRKFFRSENIASKDTDGTGLGLYLVSLIAGLLNGKISFVSKEGKRSGSTFTLSLPVTVVA